ncbi:hypothetical protein ACS0TY_006941 [Phlomoides rotata]
MLMCVCICIRLVILMCLLSINPSFGVLRVATEIQFHILDIILGIYLENYTL